MDEKKLRKQLIRITVITVVSCLVLCLVGVFLLQYVMQAVHESAHEQMRIETQEYKERILKQMDKDIQILTTLAKAYEVSSIANDKDQLEQSLTATNSANDFISMLYIWKDGHGVMSTATYGTRSEITLEDCDPYAIDVIEMAFEGNNGISKMFDSDVYGEKLCVYAVPVYQNGKVVGALAASDTLEIFTDIANGKAVMGGAGYINLINSEGRVLVRSQNTLIKEDVNTIYDGSYLTEKTKEQTRLALSKQESVLGEFRYEGTRCHYYLEPLGMNGWYLFCANTVWGAHLALGGVLVITGVVVLLVLLVVNGLLYAGYRQFRKAVRALIRIAYQDQVTGAENTIRFNQRFNEISSQHKNYSTVAMNVHNFKGINDLFGQDRGDKVLCYLKEMIEGMLKTGEFFCRDTADLFYILLLDNDEQLVQKRMQKIIDHISRVSLDYGEYSYELSTYCGIAICGDRERALLAMQSIQNSHQKSIAFYNHVLHDEVRRKNSIESHMYAALQNKEFKLFLQPKFNLKTDALVGAEALVRWQNPDGSFRMPGEFIPLFEKNGFCLKLDMYMVERVCKQIRMWMDVGITPAPISINQSKLLFSDLNYPENVSQILAKYHVPPSLITLEILESVATENFEQINKQIEALHEKGFRISMDDFGSGYSSLNMLYQLDIDELKLDRGFLRKVSEEELVKRQAIVEQVVVFAKKFGIATVAEGVETQEDRDFVKRLNFDFVQGYFYDRPIAAAEFSRKYMNFEQGV